MVVLIQTNKRTNKQTNIWYVKSLWMAFRNRITSSFSCQRLGHRIQCT